MITPLSKIYVQLQPDRAGLNHLLALQRGLEPRKDIRLVPEAQLHMTVIHFGKLEAMLPNILKHTDADEAEVLGKTEVLAQEFEAIVSEYTDVSFKLEPLSVKRFGERNGSLVVTYETNEILNDLHARCLEKLNNYFTAINIRDIDAFMAEDYNFKHARTISPHVTIAKSYVGHDPDVTLVPVTMTIMNVRYQ